jgi:hypothetical protein
MQPGPWAMIVLHAKRSAAPATPASDDAELAPIRPEAWAAWAQAGRSQRADERSSDVPGPDPIRRAARRSRWFRETFVR